jgi:hypothetical protein
MSVGLPSPPEPRRLDLLPRFPIAIEGDIPLKLVGGCFSAGGVPEQPESHVAYFREHGTIRAEPLSPTERPFAALEALAASHPGIFTDNGGFGRRQLVIEQLLWLVESVYRVEAGRFGELLPNDENEAARLVAHASSLTIKWDATQQKYTFPEGTSLEERKELIERAGELLTPRYPRHVWAPKAPGLNAELVIQRIAPRNVSIRLVETTNGVKPAVFKVFEIKSQTKTLLDFQAGGNRFPFGTRSTAHTVDVKEGKELQIELLAADGASDSELSPVFKP